MKTKVYYASVSPLCDDSIYRKYYGILPRSRREKADGISYEKSRLLSAGAGVLLSAALMREGIDPLGIEVEYMENGKPVLKDSGVCFNLSHSGERVMCAVSDDPVGCDVELMRPIKKNIAKRFFFGSEYERIAGAKTEEERLDLFFRYWTLKESFMKATGLGFKLPLDEFCISIGKEKISVSHKVDRNEYYFKEYDPGDGYKYACCSAADSLPEEMEYIEF